MFFCGNLLEEKEVSDMNLKFWEAVLGPIFWVTAPVALVGAVVVSVAGAVRTIEDIRNHDIGEAATSIGITAFMGAFAASVALLIRAVVFT